MASSMRLITSNLIKRSFFPTLVSASRFLIIDAGHRSYTTVPSNGFWDQSWQKIMSPEISSMSITMTMDALSRSLAIIIKDQNLHVGMSMSGLKVKDMRPCVDPNDLFFQGKTQLDDKDAVMANILANSIASFRDITTKRCWPYSDMFSDRSILGKGLCPIIAMLSPIGSFSISKTETAKSLHTSISISRNEKTKLTMQGLRVSYFVGPEKPKSVKTYFDYDTFFIEEKLKGGGIMIKGIHLPDGFQMNNNLVKTQIKDLDFYAYIPSKKKKVIRSVEI